MPEITKSGFSGLSMPMASNTQSVGVPSTWKAPSGRRVARKGRCNVRECDVPLCSRSRSEEHTSELQSLAYLVCRLLLEKKKTNNHNSVHWTLNTNEQARLPRASVKTTHKASQR